MDYFYYFFSCLFHTIGKIDKIRLNNETNKIVIIEIVDQLNKTLCKNEIVAIKKESTEIKIAVLLSIDLILLLCISNIFLHKFMSTIFK